MKQEPKPKSAVTDIDYSLGAISCETTLLNKTGTWRNFRPVYENKLPPCSDGCPASEDIQKYIDFIVNGKYEEAYHVILEKNPFPSITGRVCYHPCETACNRKDFDEPLAIHNIERFIGDYGLKKVEKKTMNRKEIKSLKSLKAAIIGSGPAGMSCAYYLAKAGIPVDVFERDDQPGGLLRTGIPRYRLPKNILNDEISKLEKLGVTFITNKYLGRDIMLEDLREKYAAVFLGVGAQSEKALKIPCEDVRGVFDGLSFLRDVNSRNNIKLGKKVLVIGGGFTAVDCARSAARLGKDVTILYRRTKCEMPASIEEVESAEGEGVKIRFLTAPLRVLVNGNRTTRGLECIKMKLGEPDDSGRRKPIPIGGSNFKIFADTIIKAVGEFVDLNSLPKEITKTGWGIKTSKWGETNLEKVYAGGDCTTGPKTVVEAIASGRGAAEKILSELGIKKLQAENIRKVVNFSGINTAYFENAARIQQGHLNGQMNKSFREVNQGYKEDELRSEASRCFSCGVCNYCDNCFVFCPDISVRKLNEGYEFIYDYCKGCGVCAEECPRSAITMYAES